MKLLKRLQQPPKPLPAEWLWTLGPLLLWFLSFQGRERWIVPLCRSNPEKCAPETINWIDRLSFNEYSASIDWWSFFTQDLSGALAAIIPVLFHYFYQRREKRVAHKIGLDLAILLQGVCWNGTLNECVRVLIQRPRPFVYTDGTHLADAVAHYTSFYSGHTSFSAVAMTALTVTLLGHKAPAKWTQASVLLGVLLVILTGLFRVLAGRHFISDVVSGAIIGATVAIGVALAHRR